MSLSDLLEEMFETARQSGAGVHRRLTSGLHVKVGLRGQRKMIIVWREGDKLPSRKECEIVARDGGIIAPKYRTWRCTESDDAFLIMEGHKAATTTAPAPVARTPEQLQQERDKAERAYLTGLLTCVSLGAACRNHWFRHHTVIQARRSYLAAASLGELREEVSGRWFAHSFRHALPYVLLVCRWVHQCRALPLMASAGKRQRKPRQKKAEVMAA